MKFNEIKRGTHVILVNGKDMIGNGSECKVTKVDHEKKRVLLLAPFMCGKSHWFSFDQIKLQDK